MVYNAFRVVLKWFETNYFKKESWRLSPADVATANKRTQEDISAKKSLNPLCPMILFYLLWEGTLRLELCFPWCFLS